MLLGRKYPREENWPRSGRVPGWRWDWEEGNIQGGHWAQAREGPRTISPKRGKYHSYQTIHCYHVDQL